MRVRCVCGDWHDLSTTALALVISAYQSGDMQRINKNGVESVCLSTAFTNARIAQFSARYPGNAIKYTKMGGAEKREIHNSLLP